MRALIHHSLFLTLLLVITVTCNSHAAIPLDEINRLVADGQYQRAVEKLDAARSGASENELQLIDRMLVIKKGRTISINQSRKDAQFLGQYP